MGMKHMGKTAEGGGTLFKREAGTIAEIDSWISSYQLS